MLDVFVGDFKGLLVINLLCSRCPISVEALLVAF